MDEDYFNPMGPGGYGPPPPPPGGAPDISAQVLAGLADQSRVQHESQMEALAKHMHQINEYLLVILLIIIIIE